MLLAETAAAPVGADAAPDSDSAEAAADAELFAGAGLVAKKADLTLLMKDLLT